MYTAMPEAASGSHRSSHTRREASTTSNGAFWNAILSGYGADGRFLGALGKGAADDPIGLERVDLRLRQTELRSSAPLCSPSSGACRRWICSGPRENRIGNVLYRDCPITGWSTSSKKRRAWSCGSSGWECGCITLPTGTPAPQRNSTISSAGRARHHSATRPSMRSCSRSAPRPARQGGICGPRRLPSTGAERDPLLVGGHRDGHPTVVPTVLVGPRHLVEVLRSRRGAAIAIGPSSDP